MSTSLPLLHGPELAPAQNKPPQQLVILLHGLGSNGDDLISLAPLFQEALPDAWFASPNAPFPCDMGPFGYQWFSLREFTPEVMLKGARYAAPILNHFIDTKRDELGLKDKDVALVGFSQGTMMSLHVALRRPHPIAGVLGYSGALLDAEPLDTAIQSRPPVCLVHGMMDPVVPFQAMERATQQLESLDVPVESHARPLLAHSIDPEGISIGQQFLEQCFA